MVLFTLLVGAAGLLPPASMAGLRSPEAMSPHLEFSAGAQEIAPSRLQTRATETTSERGADSGASPGGPEIWTGIQQARVQIDGMT